MRRPNRGKGKQWPEREGWGTCGVCCKEMGAIKHTNKNDVYVCSLI